jgi:hypothetical protein
MTPQPKHAYEDVVSQSIPGSGREAAPVETLGSAVDAPPVATSTSSERRVRLRVGLFSLSLVGLALAIFFWGLEYKLSLYHPHSTHSARLGVAKLWNGPRKAAFSKSNCVKSSAPGAQEFHLLTNRFMTASDRTEVACGSDAELLFVDGGLSNQRTPRSPPALSLCN